jgi:subtilisin family serine protease
MAETRKYVLLRTRRAFPTVEPFSLPSSTFSLPGGPIELPAGTADAGGATVERADLTRTEVANVSRDPTVAALTPDMPIKLIEPVQVSGSGSGSTSASGSGPASAAPAAAGPTWGVDAIGATTSPANGQGIVVAVLDTGIDASHSAFAGISLDQRDFSGAGNGDVQGHGTHCAGTIFGRDVGGTRIGVARGVTKALIGKVLDNSGRGSSENLFNGMLWASENGAHVISMSLGFDFPGLVADLVAAGWPVEAATSAALEAYRGNLRMFDNVMGLIRARGEFGVSSVVVAASGNESKRPTFEIAASLPAAADHVISVGALEQDGTQHKIARFSNTLPQISAPGVNVSSAKAGGGLVAFNGTSMACPHVAGAAVLWWQVIRQSALPLKAEVVRARLFAAARTSTFAAGTDVADRGVGLATCPATATV